MACRNRFRQTGRRVVASVAIALILKTQLADAHTVSVGYENAGAGAVTFWYGTYHAGTNFTEGSLQLVGPGTNTTVGFTSVVQVKPTGLTDGTTNFYSNGTALVGSFAASAYVGSGTPVAWQGVTFTGLTAGTYTFTYIPIGSPTATWQPIDNVILSSTVILSAAVLGGGSLAPSATTGNQLNLASAIDNALAGGATNASFSNLSSLTGAALSNALTELAGEAAAGSQQAGFQMMNPFLTLLLDPFVGSRSTGAGFGPALGFGPQAKLSDAAKEAYAAVTPQQQQSEVARRWSVWSTGYGGRNQSEGDALTGSHDGRVNAWGTAVGVDYRVDADSTIGIATGAGASSWNLSAGLGGGDSQVFQVGVYGSTRSGPMYASAALAYAYNRMSTDRTIDIAGTDRLQADFDAHTLGARLETGYRFGSANFGVSPYVAAQMQTFLAPAYSENATSGSNAFALDYGHRTANDLRSEIGGWVDRRLMIDWEKQVLLRARAAWAHDWASAASIGATFQTLPTATFIVDGARQPKDTALASLSAELQLANGFSFCGRLDGEFAREATTYVATGSLRYDW
jgi:uncharacterized protein with beta-barrel porin domain